MQTFEQKKIKNANILGLANKTESAIGSNKTIKNWGIEGI
jgi:hypothetical protein